MGKSCLNWGGQKLFSLRWAKAVFMEVSKSCIFWGGQKLFSLMWAKAVFSEVGRKLFSLRWTKAVFTEVGKSCFHWGRQKLFYRGGQNCFHWGGQKLFSQRWAKAVFTEVAKGCFHWGKKKLRSLNLKSPSMQCQNAICQKIYNLPSKLSLAQAQVHNCFELWALSTEKLNYDHLLLGLSGDLQ